MPAQGRFWGEGAMDRPPMGEACLCQALWQTRSPPVNTVNKPSCYKMTRLAAKEQGMIAAGIIVIGFIVSMLMAGRVAESRGRSMRAWIWFAAVFGPLATLAAWALPAKRARSHVGANVH